MSQVASMPKQSWQSAMVDISMIAAIVILAIRGTHDTFPWWVLSQIAFVRFGVGAMKQVQADSRGGGNGGSGGGGGGGGGSGQSGDQYQAVRPEQHPERPPVRSPGRYPKLSQILLTPPLFLAMFCTTFALALNLTHP